MFSGRFYHSSKFYFNATDQLEQGAHNTLALRAEWTDPSDRFTVALYGDNVAGTRYLTEASAGVPLGGGTGWSSPALMAGEIRARFPCPTMSEPPRAARDVAAPPAVLRSCTSRRWR